MDKVNNKAASDFKCLNFIFDHVSINGCHIKTGNTAG